MNNLTLILSRLFLGGNEVTAKQLKMIPMIGNSIICKPNGKLPLIFSRHLLYELTRDLPGVALVITFFMTPFKVHRKI